MEANGTAILVMCSLFVLLGYFGVPVAFALIAGVVISAALFTDLTIASLMGELFNGINKLDLLAVPFFLLAGELMTSADITIRLVRFAQTLVGHFRSGLAQVVSVSSMIFSGISGSSTADAVAIGTVLLPAMKKEGYDPEFSAALIAAASTIANMIPPSIMAIVYGAVGSASIGGLFLGGATPGVMVGVGLMIYCYFFGAPGMRKPRASLFEIGRAMKQAALPLMIPLIIIGGILTGQFTPTEAAMVAVVYVVLVVLPTVNRRHFRHLPRDFVFAAVLYSIPMMAVAGASGFGWMLAYFGAPTVVGNWVQTLGINTPREVLFVLVVLFVIVGDFLDAIPAIIIFMPVIETLQKIADVNAVHMGVVVIVTLAFGLITPPYGLCLLLTSMLAQVRFSRAVLRSLPIYVVFFSVIALIIWFPDLVLWLPRLLLPQSVGCFRNPSGAGFLCPQ
jgi:tripartite ATP-independent transporter DctM subunit